MVHGFVLLLEVGSLRCVSVGEDVDDGGRIAAKPFEGAVELDCIVPGRRKHWWNDHRGHCCSATKIDGESDETKKKKVQSFGSF